jgi:hypothetical protein
LINTTHIPSQIVKMSNFEEDFILISDSEEEEVCIKVPPAPQHDEDEEEQEEGEEENEEEQEMDDGYFEKESVGDYELRRKAILLKPSFRILEVTVNDPIEGELLFVHLCCCHRRCVVCVC